MTRRSALSLGAVGLLSATARANQAEPRTRRTLNLEGQTYLVGAAEQAAQADTQGLWAAPGGRYLLSVCHKRDGGSPYFIEAPPEGRRPTQHKSLSLWDNRLQQARTLWRYAETENARVLALRFHRWITPVVALIEYWDSSPGNLPYTSKLLVVNCGSGQVQEICPFPGRLMDVRLGHPTLSPFAVMVISDVSEGDSQVRLTVVGPSGVEAQRNISRPFSQVGWSEDGQRFYFSRFDTSELKPYWFALDRNLREFPMKEMWKDLADFREQKISLPMQCVERAATLTVASSKETLVSLWLAAGKEHPVRVAAEIDPGSAVLLPDLSGVAYKHRGALYVAPLTKLAR